MALVKPAAAQNVVSDIPLAGGGSERVVFTSPANPTAILVMFAGGDGIVEIADTGTIYRLSNNFLMRTQPLWLAQGFAVEILGAPNNASLNGQRKTEAYADAIGRAVAFARTRASAPVWLVGTSAGTTGAANGAARLTGRVAGLVLTSSVTRQKSGGETVFDTNLAAITVPVLIVANRRDSCIDTPPDDAAMIAAALTRSRARRWFMWRATRPGPGRRPARRCRRTAISALKLRSSSASLIGFGQRQPDKG